MDQKSLAEVRQEVQELIKSDDAKTGIMVGNDVYDAHIFNPEQVRFNVRQYRFLYAYRLGTPLAEAALKAGLSVSACESFLEKPDTKAWLLDRAKQDYVKNEWAEPSKWWAEGEAMRLREEVPKHAIDIWREFGERICPKTSRNADNVSTKIEININPSAVQAAFDRNKAIDAQISQELSQ